MLKLVCSPNRYHFSVDELQNEIFASIGWDIWEKAISGNLSDFADNTGYPWPPISVVVCTRDRLISLKRCLSSLSRLNYPKYEVVVVDNCSRDSHAVERAVTEFNYRYLYEARQGLNWARNRGYQEAQYDIIAYIDDDAVASSAWLKGIAIGFKDSATMVVTGMVLPAEIETVAQNDFEVYGGMNKGFIAFSIHRECLADCERYWASNWGVGTNMAVRKKLFTEIGDFDVGLDVGTPTNGGGDIEFIYRSVSSGHWLRYEPTAIVKHYHRRDYWSFKRQIYNNGRSFVAYLLTIHRNEPQNRSGLLKFTIKNWLWKWLLLRLVRSILRFDKWTFKIALKEICGALSGIRAYRKAQQNQNG